MLEEAWTQVQSLLGLEGTAARTYFGKTADQLTHGDLASFFNLLVVAGNETTRNAISHGVLALTHHPDQRRQRSGHERHAAPQLMQRERAHVVAVHAHCALAHVVEAR